MPDHKRSKRQGALFIMNLVHSAFNDCLNIMNKKFDKMDAKTDVSSYAHIVNEFLKAYSQHVEQEDKVYFPWLEENQPKITKNHKKDHKDLARMFTVFQKGWKSRLESGHGGEKALKKSFGSFAKNLTEHCIVEEKMTEQLVKSTSHSVQAQVLRSIYNEHGDEIRSTIVFCLRHLKKKERKAYASLLKQTLPGRWSTYILWLQEDLPDIANLLTPPVPALDLAAANGANYEPVVIVPPNYNKQIRDLSSQGFTDAKLNVTFLNRYDGKTNQVAEVLKRKAERVPELAPEWKDAWDKLAADLGLKPKVKYLRLMARFEGDVTKVLEVLNRQQAKRNKQDERAANELRYADDLKTLYDNGYPDLALNLRLLTKHSGQEEQVMAALRARAEEKFDPKPEWRDALSTLHQNGFTDDQINLRALIRTDGDVDQAMERIEARRQRNEKMKARMDNRIEMAQIELKTARGPLTNRGMRAPRLRAGKFRRTGREKDEREKLEELYAEQLQKLDALGHYSVKRNLRMLKRRNGNVEEIAAILDARKRRKQQALTSVRANDSSDSSSSESSGLD